MREAAIISTARTGLAKAMRGGFNKTHGITMGGHTVKHAIERAGVEAGEVEDVIFGFENNNPLIKSNGLLVTIKFFITLNFSRIKTIFWWLFLFFNLFL